MAIQFESSIDVDGRAIIGTNNSVSTFTGLTIIGDDIDAATNTIVDSNTSVILGDGSNDRYGNVAITDRTLRLGRADQIGASSANTTGILNFNDSVLANAAYSNIGGIIGYFPPPTTTNDYFFFNALSENVNTSVFQTGASPTASRYTMSTSPTLNGVGQKFDANTTNGGAMYITASNNSSTASSRGIFTFDARHQNQNFTVPNGHSLFEVTSGYGQTKFLIKQVSGSTNVGIGTTSPQRALQVSTTGTNDYQFRLGTDTYYYDVGRNTSDGFLYFYGNQSNASGFVFETTNGERMRIDHDGNVGIGTDSPNTALEVDGAISTTTSDYAQGSTGSRLLLETPGSGNTHSYIQAQSSGGSTSNEDLALQLYGGSVGIGTDSPSQKLHVSGSARITGAIYDSNNSPGTSGQVLSSTATGTDWIDGSAIPGVPDGSGTAGKIVMWQDSDTLTDSKITQTAGSETNYVDIDFANVEDLTITGDSSFSTFTVNAFDAINFSNIENNFNVGSGDLSIATGDSSMSLGTTTADSNTLTAGYATTRFIGTGNFGIGTTSPSEKLVVSGNTSITNNLYVGYSNSLLSCTYPAAQSLIVGRNNSLGGVDGAIIGYNNSIACTQEPWLNFGGNFIAGITNNIVGGYSHANAVFGQLNEVGTSSINVSNALIGGSEHEVTSANVLMFGRQCRAFNSTYSLTGGFDSNNFGGFGSVAIGAGATASLGNNQYAFGTGVTTPTTASAAYGADQFVVGKFNEYTNSSFVSHRFAVGNGSSDFSRDTPFCIIGSGTYTNGQVSINDSDGFAYSSAPYSILHVNGRATSSYSSAFTVTSDERVKKNIADYNKGLVEILQVQPKSYSFNGKANTIEGVESIGVLAQEIKEVFPETVGTANKKLNPEDEQETELYTVDISPVTYALINAVKELNAKVEALETRIQTLEGN